MERKDICITGDFIVAVGRMTKNAQVARAILEEARDQALAAGKHCIDRRSAEAAQGPVKRQYALLQSNPQNDDRDTADFITMVSK
jgi:hypothetical protein